MEAMLTTTTTSTFLPQEIVMDILSRLPANSLVSNFKLVCKAWCTLIQDPDFIKMHLSRRCKISPRQPIQYPQGFTKTPAKYGFGCCYNPATNIHEYKVVRIVCFVTLLRSQVDVYCMSSNSWRTETKIRDNAFRISSRQSGVFVNEALHWVVASLGGGHWDTIASFDIRDEEFRQVPIPLPCESYDDEPYFNLAGVTLMNMKGCLSMIHLSHRRNVMEAAEAADLEIWVMKEYGIKESWTKEFVIRSWGIDLPLPRTLSDIVISWIFNANVLKGDQMERLVFTKKGCQSLYDLNMRKINEDFRMVGGPDELSVDIVNYIETLVSLKSSVLPL